MRHYFDFDGVKSSDYGVLISEENTFGAPARDVEEITVPGRDGNLTIDNGRFSAATHIYPAFIPETAKVNLAGLRNALMSKRGHRRLWDTLHADEFYKAYYEKGLEPEVTANLRHAALEIEFTRDPRRFLVEGEAERNIPAATVTTSSGDVVIFTAKAATGATVVSTDDGMIYRNGKNLAPPVTVGLNIDNTTGAASGTASTSDVIASFHEFVRVDYTANSKYTFSWDATGARADVKLMAYAYNASGEYLGRATGSTANPRVLSKTSFNQSTTAATGDPTFVRVRMYVSTGTITPELMENTNLQLEEGDRATEYEPYTVASAEYTGTAVELPLVNGINKIWASDGAVTVTLDEPYVLNNPTSFASSPLIRVHGQGVLYIGNMSVTVAGSFPYVDIDTEVGDCYYGSANANPYVTFSGYEYPKLAPGPNYIRYTGLSAVEVTPRWWRL